MLSDLKSAFPELVMEPGSPDSWLGNGGHVHVYPTSEKEVVGLLKFAYDHGKSVSVQGNGSKRGFGGLKESYDVLLSLSKYTGVIEHSPGDMVVTVKAGTAFHELQAYLAKHQQQVSLDPAMPHLSTVGGVIASNDSGPKRMGYGSARDIVLGLKVVYPDGTVIRTGGKVVKNVAGYDMNKLFIGSMGTIGVITEITLKLMPLPKCESLVFIPFQDNRLDELRSFVVTQFDSTLEPTAFEFISPSLAEQLTGRKRWALAIGLEDVESSVIYQENIVKQAVPKEAADVYIFRSEEARAFWNGLMNISPNGMGEPSEQAAIKVGLKIGVKNIDVLQMLAECVALQQRHNLVVYGHGGFGHGLCHVVLQGTSEDVEAAIQALRGTAKKLNGYVIVKHIPFFLRQSINVWGDKPDYFSLFEGIKASIDPRRVLNETRFIGGI
ncbi:FAD-binding oxidoreductase [Shouchella clausii]|uniref:FAD-binding oxidoreductase n=1 Tax=Shouchella clausii TaxID=79880 RepID=UPI00270A76F1|nr:FAD-binding oxidoreductase [Shouchella clausii]MDO7267159.1 FAD-binding oxidoreductase [Shouchella clausii]MDO7287887.1 FAD-binding oxidoreductase [Shouchella clausii]